MAVFSCPAVRSVAHYCQVDRLHRLCLLFRESVGVDFKRRRRRGMPHQKSPCANHRRNDIHHRLWLRIGNEHQRARVVPRKRKKDPSHGFIHERGVALMLCAIRIFRHTKPDRADRRAKHIRALLPLPAREGQGVFRDLGQRHRVKLALVFFGDQLCRREIFSLLP